MKKKNYKPNPIELSDIQIPEELKELQEKIAKHIHDVWAKGRMEEGWTYGPERDDKQKKHPDLIEYLELPEGEKEYDRATAMNTIKLILKLGFKIERGE